VSEPQLFLVTKKMLWKLIKHEQERGEFSTEGAIASMLYDRMRGKEFSQREYQQVWGWSRKKVRYNWDQITSTAALLLLNSQGPHKGHAGAQNAAKSDEKSQVGATQGPRKGPHLYNNYLSNTKNISKLKGSAVPKESRLVEKKSPSHKKKSTHFDSSSWQYRFASAHLDALERLSVAPQSALRDKPKTIQRDAAVFDKLHRIDGHTQEEIQRVMKWLLSPTNWWIENGNYASAEKLRKSKDGQKFFEKFQIQSLNKNGSAKSSTNNRTPAAPEAGSTGYTHGASYGDVLRAVQVANRTLNPEPGGVARASNE